MRHSVSVTCCALLVSSFSLAYAADVPGGTVPVKNRPGILHRMSRQDLRQTLRRLNK